IKPVNDQVPFAEVQLTAQHNVPANEQQHIEQSEPIYDTYLLEKVDGNNTPDSTNMCHRGGEINQDAEQYQAKIPLLKAEFLKTNDMDAPEFCKFFEINDLKAQLPAKTTLICNLKNQIKSVKEASNKAKVKHEIDVLETINIELESSVAKLLAENEKLNKENEHLKQTYKELYDSIKKTRIQTKDHNDSLIAQVNSKTVENADLKAQIQEKVFANVALKNELRKLKGNSVDTKFAKPSILGKPVLQPPRNQSVVRQPNAFKSERPNFSKPRFASQVDVNNVLSKPVTPHYLPKVREYVLAKPHHVIAPGSSRNSQEESYGSNDMAHNHYLEEARKKTQERNRNSKPSVMHTTSLQNTTNGSKPNPRSNNQISRSLPVSKSSCGMSNGVSLVDHSRNSSSFSDSKHFVCSTCHKCVFNANHDNCITKFLKEVNSRAKVQSPKTRNNNKLVEPKSHTQKPSRQIAIGQRFSPKKSSAVHEKPNTPRSCLRWKPTGRIFKIAGLRWIPTGKMFTDYTTKVDSEPPNGSNDDITNPYECDQTLNVGAGTANLSAGLALQRWMTFGQNSSSLVLHQKMFGQNSSGLVLHLDDRSLLHDNIVPKPDLALELGKSISLTEAEEEAVAREVHATHARIVSGPDPEPMQEDQTGSNSGKLHVSLAGPNPEHMDDEFLATAYPKVHENLKLITDERVIEENPESHSGSMSSMKNLDDTYNFGDQFLYDKPTEDDQEKSKVIEESDSTIPDPSHQTVTSTPPVIAPFTDVSSIKPSSLVSPPPINTEATTITTSLPEITPFIALQLRVARLEQEMSEVKKTDHSADVLASIKSQVPTVVDEYLGTKLDDALLKILERHTADLIEKYSSEDACDKDVKDRVKKPQKKHEHDDDEDDMMMKGPSLDQTTREWKGMSQSKRTLIMLTFQCVRPLTMVLSHSRSPRDLATLNSEWTHSHRMISPEPEITGQIHTPQRTSSCENQGFKEDLDIGSFIKWSAKKQERRSSAKADLEGPAINLVKAFISNSVFFISGWMKAIAADE
ncbi:hypothetical protein Tco_0540815, partial [Tanacetum coccineum]